MGKDNYWFANVLSFAAFLSVSTFLPTWIQHLILQDLKRKPLRSASTCPFSVSSTDDLAFLAGMSRRRSRYRLRKWLRGWERRWVGAEEGSISLILFHIDVLKGAFHSVPQMPLIGSKFNQKNKTEKSGQSMGRVKEILPIEAKRAYCLVPSKPLILFGAWNRNRTGTALSAEGF